MRVRIKTIKKGDNLSFRPQKRVIVWTNFLMSAPEPEGATIIEFSDVGDAWKYLYTLDKNWTMITSASVATLKLKSSRSVLKELGSWVENKVNTLSDKLSKSE